MEEGAWYEEIGSTSLEGEEMLEVEAWRVQAHCHRYDAVEEGDFNLDGSLRRNRGPVIVQSS